MIENKSTPTIAVFDFDGTITTKDTLFDFIAFYHGKVKLALGLVLLSPILILFKLKVFRNDFAKQRMFSLFFRNTKVEDFDKRCVEYINQINAITRPEAIDRIKWHQSEGHKVIIISASVVDWIRPWAQSVGITEVMATGMATKNGKLTGRFSTKNCHGVEKMNRLLEIYPNKSTYKLYMYGDSNGDKDMLEIADFPFYRKFE